MPQIVEECAAYIEQCHHLSARDPVQLQEIPDKSWGDTIQWDTARSCSHDMGDCCNLELARVCQKCHKGVMAHNIHML